MQPHTVANQKQTRAEKEKKRVQKWRVRKQKFGRLTKNSCVYPTRGTDSCV